MAKNHGEDALVQPTLEDVQAWRELEASEAEYLEYIRAEAIRLKLINPPNPLITLSDQTNEEAQAERAESLMRQAENVVNRARQEYQDGGFIRPGGRR